MTESHRIQQYINTLPEPKRSDMAVLHTTICERFPEVRLRFLEGTAESGNVVSNPNIGYGSLTLHYANGSTREFYQVGISANASGISVYVMCLSNKQWLANTIGTLIGKAQVTSYCIKFKKLGDIHLGVLLDAISGAMEQTSQA